MKAVDRAAEAMLRFAARRWPEELREEQHREWLAELAEIRRRSAFGQLRYAFSLAASPPVEDEGGVPRGWREEVPVISSALRPFFLFAFAAVFCGVLAGGISVLGAQILELVRGYPAGLSPYYRFDVIDWATHIVQFAALAVAAFFAVLIGRWLGRRALSFGWAHSTRLGDAGSAVLAPFGILLGIAALSVMQVFPAGAFNLPLTIPAAAVFAVGMAGLGRRVVGLRSAGRKLAARVTAAVGSILLLDLVGFVAGLRPALESDLPLWSGPVWFPLSLLDPMGTGFEFGLRDQGYVASQSVVGAVSSSTRLLVVACALLWAYNKFVVVVPKAAPVREPVPRTARLGAGIAVVALLIWGYASAVLTPALTPAVDEVGEFHLWVHEIRLSAIVAALLGMSLTLAGRGAVVIPGLAAAAGLIAVDSLVDRRDLAGPVVLGAVVAMGLAILLTAVALGRFLGGGSGRRTATGVAVMGAVSGPAIFFQAPDWDVNLPAGMAVATAADVFLILLAACGAAFAVAQRPRWVVFTVTGVVAGGLGALGLLTLSGQEIIKAGMLAQLPVAAVLLLVIGWPRQSWWKWTLLFASAVLLAVPMIYLDLAVSVAFADVLFGAAGFGFPADGLPMFSGAAVTGFALGGLLSLVTAAPARVPGLSRLAV